MKNLSILVLACLLAMALFIPVATPALAATPTTITLVSSDAATQTAGYTQTNPSPTPLDATLYSTPAWPNAANVTSPVIPPWIDPTTDVNFAGSGAVWVSTTADNYGNDGNILTDSWRLFKAEFTIPLGATAISGQVTAATADNTFEIYFNGLLFTTEPDNTVYGPAPSQPFPRDPPYPFQQVYGPFNISPAVGLNTLYFVVRNWDNFNSSSSNPTGLVYKATITYTLSTGTTTTTKLTLDKKSCFGILPCFGKLPTITLGQGVQDKATVTGADPAATSGPTGNVQFQVSMDNGVNWNTYSTNALTASGPITATATSDSYVPAGAGSYLFRAVYDGDDTYNTSQSADKAEPLKVCQVPTYASTQLSDRTICLNDSVTDKINIFTMVKGTLPAATGTWALLASKDPFFKKGVSTVDSGDIRRLPFMVTSQSFTPTSTGFWYFRVVYSGDSNYGKSQNCNLEVLCVVNKVIKPTQPPCHH